MGAEAMCRATIDGRSVHGKARLETDTLFFRAGDVRVNAPFRTMTRVSARAGILTVGLQRGPVSFELGDAAEKWAKKIRHPPSRLTKLGVKPDWRVSVIGPAEPAFLDELAPLVASLSATRIRKPSHAIFFFLSQAADLDRIPALRKSLIAAGALWLVRPKGHPDLSERAVMAAGKAAGLVDVKVVGFSPTHTAEKFVIPLEDRHAAGS